VVLAPNDFCDLTVQFSAGISATTAMDQLNIMATPGGSFVVPLSGEARGVHLSLTPVGPLSFTTISGMSTSQPLMLMNDGLQDAAGPLSALVPDGHFSVSGCTLSLLPVGGSCQLMVTYSPFVVGAHSGSVTLSMGNATSNTVLLNGTSTQPGALMVTPNGWNFGAIDTGAIAQQTFLVRNIGAAPTDPLSASALPAPFSLLADGCHGLALPPDAGCNVIINFQPLDGGSYSSLVRWDGGLAGTVPLQLDGTGVDEVTLLLMPTGAGSGVISSSFTGGGMRDGGVPACDAGTCMFNVRRGSTMTFQATPNATTSVSPATWTNACAGNTGASCSLTMSAMQLVGAQFDLKQVSVQVNVTGLNGRVTSSPPGIDCASGASAGCTANFSYGTQVTLTATGFRSVATQATGCTLVGNTCTVTATGGAPVSFTFSPVNVAFVSSALLLGGQVPGSVDILCGYCALDAGLSTNGGPTVWRGYVSTAGAPVSSWIGDGGFVRPDGRVITVGSLYTGRLRLPIMEDEHGNAPALVDPVATATTQTGAYSATNCGGFVPTTSTSIAAGNYSATSLAWSDQTTTTGCRTGDSLHFYCFSTNATARPLPPTRPPPGARVAFISRLTVASTASNTTIDTTCNDDAHDAGLPGTFVAARGSAGLSIVSRIGSPDAGMWYRLDGEPLAATPTEFLSGTGRGAPIDVQANGVTVDAGVQVWTGTGSTLTYVPLAVDTCSGWSPGSTGSGIVGATGDSRTIWATGFPASCSGVGGYRVYCFQQ
jgi:hypothetical protein